jgi:hypothetical protein
MPRNSKGWLKADALRNGIPDQVARDIGDKRHIVQIVHDSARGGFVLEHSIASLSDLNEWEVHEWQCGTNLPEARGKFNAIIRSFGRA